MRLGKYVLLGAFAWLTLILILSSCGDKDITVKNYRSDGILVDINGGANFSVQSESTVTRTHKGPDTFVDIFCTQGMKSFYLSDDITIICPENNGEPYEE